MMKMIKLHCHVKMTAITRSAKSRFLLRFAFRILLCNIKYVDTLSDKNNSLRWCKWIEEMYHFYQGIVASALLRNRTYLWMKAIKVMSLSHTTLVLWGYLKLLLVIWNTFLMSSREGCKYLRTQRLHGKHHFASLFKLITSKIMSLFTWGRKGALPLSAAFPEDGCVASRKCAEEGNVFHGLLLMSIPILS